MNLPAGPEESGPCIGPWGPGTVAEGQAVLQRFMVGKTEQELYDLPPWEMLWGQGAKLPIKKWFRKSFENGLVLKKYDTFYNISFGWMNNDYFLSYVMMNV